MPTATGDVGKTANMGTQIQVSTARPSKRHAKVGALARRVHLAAGVEKRRDMTDTAITPRTTEFVALEAVLRDVQGACDSLPAKDKKRHVDAQRSVIDARRSAETHEGLLQVC